MKILDGLKDGWVIVNGGIPIDGTFRSTRRDCISRYCHSRTLTQNEWKKMRDSEAFACVKVRLEQVDD